MFTKDISGLCRVVVRHTEQIRQIRKIRQIRDHALLLAAALRSRKPNQGHGFRGSFGSDGSFLGADHSARLPGKALTPDTAVEPTPGVAGGGYEFRTRLAGRAVLTEVARYS